MQPEDQQPSTNAEQSPPLYPDRQYYQDLAAKAAQQQPANGRPVPQKYAETPYLPSLQALPSSQRARSHNGFTRFVIAWGGMNRLLLSLGSALVSVIVYTYLFAAGSWAFGFGLVGLICVHELGHAFALRIKKLPATFPIFIPGMGAFVTLPNQPISMRDDADISLAGPFLGGIGSLVCLIASFVFLRHYPDGFVGPDPILGELASFSFFINVLNLIPVLPLDGGHVARVLSRWLGAIGIALLAILYFVPFAGNLLYQSILLLFIGFLGINDVIRSFNAPVRQMVMRDADRVFVAFMYGGLAIFLALGYWIGNNHDVLLSLLNWRLGLSPN